MVIRELYLRKIRPFYDSELIKVITGVRRCGKSTLLKQIYEELIDQGIEREQIVFLNFEDYTYRALTDPDVFHEFIVERIDTRNKWYLLFDEIQLVTNFELVVNSFRAVYNVSIFITGSNSKILSGELSTHLGGRTVSWRMLPFTFKEFCRFTDRAADRESLTQYTTWGGFPTVCAAPTDDMKQAILSSLYDSIVLKDIIMRNKVTSAYVLEKVLEYLISASSHSLSGNAIAKALHDGNQKITTPTVYDYIRYCTDACIVTKVQRYDIRGKKKLAFEEKVYVADLGLFLLKKNRVKGEFSIITETLIYNELIARGYQVYIGKTYRGEVDFIAQRNRKICYIQAAYLLDSQKTIDREFGAYSAVADHHPKFVISNDDWTLGEQDGIIHLPLLDFLTDEDALPG